MKKYIAIFAVLILMSLCILAGCGNKYNALLYDNAAEWINDKFQSENRVKGAYYEGDYEDDYPESRTFILTNQEDIESVFDTNKLAEFEMDFETEMLIIYTFSIEYILPAEIESIDLNEQTLSISYKINLIEEAGSATQPFQRWFIVKLDKLDISSVKFVRK